MSRIKAKLNLAALKHVKMQAKGRSGQVKGIFIPFEANNLFVSEEKGNVYLDLIGFEMKEKKDYATHIAKQSLSKDIRDKMSEEEQKSMPIFGNFALDDGSFETDAPGAVSSDEFTESDKLPF